MAVLLSIHELHHAFPHHTLFEGLTFSVNSGEKIALIGQNGAGKSTLLKILNGEVDPDGGTVSRMRGLKVGYLDQSPKFGPKDVVHDVVFTAAGTSANADLSAQEILSRLDLNQYEQAKVTSLSGGWQKKVALARELAKGPDILLLDEPTNHLDIDSILWLEEWVQDSELCIITVSHDRAFLRNTSKRVIEIDKRNPKGILSVDGTYDEFLKIKQDYIEGQIAREASLKNTLRREVEWLSRGAKARTTKQKARIDRAEDLKQEVQTLSYKNSSQSVKLEFDAGSSAGPKKMVELKGVSKGYKRSNSEKGSAAEKGAAPVPLFTNLNLKITARTRLGLLGNNGTGKSTLLKLIVGEETPDQGTIDRADRMNVAYFNQTRETLDPNISVLRTVCPYGETVEFQGNKIHVRSYLDRFLFSGARVDMMVSKLSGGEQARLLLAQLMLRPANFLILDEPTNDLDLQTLGVLEDCLEEFPGAVILVTHDRAFLDDVCDQILAFPEMQFYSDLSQWEKTKRTQNRDFGRSTASKNTSSSNSGPSSANASSSKKKKLSYKEQLEYDGMQKTIQDKENKLNALMERSSEPAIVSSPMELKKIMSEIATLQKEIETHYERWVELEQKVSDNL